MGALSVGMPKIFPSLGIGPEGEGLDEHFIFGPSNRDLVADEVFNFLQ